MLEIQIKSATSIHESRKKIKKLNSGDSDLNELLDGGFIAPNLYLLYGNRAILQKILLMTSVNSQLPSNLGGFGTNSKVGFIDCDFSFKPYFITRQSLLVGLDANQTLENILISRAFTWENLVELLSERIEALNSRLIIVSGLTDFFNPETESSFQDLLRGIGKLKEMVLKKKLVAIVTTGYAENSKYKPAGGRILSHFVTMIVEIKASSNRIEYRILKGDRPKKKVRWVHAKTNVKLQRSLENFLR